MDIGKFTVGIVGAVLGVILLVVIAIPVINDNPVASNVANYQTLNTILGVLPIIMAIGIVIGVIAVFMRGNN